MGNYLYFLICIQGVLNSLDIWSNQDQRYEKYYLNYRFGVYENQRETSAITKEEICIVDKLREFQKRILMKGQVPKCMLLELCLNLRNLVGINIYNIILFSL